MTDLLELAARCENATGADDALDWAIAEAVGCAPGLSYSASLDAAMSLIQAPTDQWGEYVSISLWDSNGVYPEHVRATAWVRGAARVYAATPALALCAASLKAIAKEGLLP